MEVETGKLFIGGISWDTNEDRLREYFGDFGEVIEAVIMRDRTTGRARGFGFVVFTDPLIAERVAKEKHIIDGRTVEAKKAVPRDGQNVQNRNIITTTHNSPIQIRTKKIFVGGLASTVTESGFKTYFEQFGTITDVVVMYDHNTQRPRGFGFITYDSEEAVDKVLTKTFHELNGKMVEVKRAVPKELSSTPTRSPLGFNHGLTRVSSFLDAYSMGGFNGRIDSRFKYPPFGNPSGLSYGMGLNMDSGLGLNFNGGGNFEFARELNQNQYGEFNPNRYNNPNPIGYGVSSGGGNGNNGGAIGSLMNQTNRNNNMWSDNFGYDTNLTNAQNNNGTFSPFGNIGGIWGSNQGGGNVSFGRNNNNNNIIGYNNNNNESSFGRNNSGIIGARNDGNFDNLYGERSVYGEEGSGTFGFSLGNSGNDENSVGYVGGYNNRANRGIAA